MTDFEGSRNVKCKVCGRWFNTAEGMQCDCMDDPKSDEEEEEVANEFCKRLPGDDV